MTEQLHFHFYALEKEMATHSSVLSWRIPGMGSHRVGHDWSGLAVAICLEVQADSLPLGHWGSPIRYVSICFVTWFIPVSHWTSFFFKGGKVEAGGWQHSSEMINKTF